MIKRTVEISNSRVHLSVHNSQLVVKADGLLRPDQRQGREQFATQTIPLEDIGLLMVEQRDSTLSVATLAGLAEHGAAVCICGPRHLPVGLLLPFSARHEIVRRVHAQIAATKPTRKRLWRQIVRAKISAQAHNVAHDAKAVKKLRALHECVKPGDPTNIEAQAAQVYWAHWLGDGVPFQRVASPTVQGPPPNDLLDYGYAVLRAAVARAIVSAGLMPILGIHHEHRSNPFCLADDLVEPLRPIVDDAVRGLYRSGIMTITREAKQALLGLLTIPVRLVASHTSFKHKDGPLMIALAGYVASFVECLPRMRPLQRLAIPSVLAEGDVRKSRAP